MADASHFYGKFAMHAFDGSADLNAGTLVALLLTSAYTFDQDAHEYISNLTGELTDASYHRVTLSGVTFAYDGSTNTVKFTCTPFTFPLLNGTWRHIVFAISTGTDSTSPLVKCTTHDVDKVSSGADVMITPHINGLGTATAA